MNIGIYNWHNWILDPTKMNSLNLFQFLTRWLTSKHLKLISTLLVGRNGAMWKTCFSAPQNAKKENQLKHKNEVRNRHLLTGLRVWRIVLVITRSAHKRQTFTLISIKIMRIWNFFLHLTFYLNTKESFPICMFVVMASGKCELHTLFNLFARNSNPLTNEKI